MIRFSGCISLPIVALLIFYKKILTVLNMLYDTWKYIRIKRGSRKCIWFQNLTRFEGEK